MGTGPTTFAEPTSYLAGTGSGAPAIADIDGDGLPDIVIGDFNTGVAVLYGVCR